MKKEKIEFSSSGESGNIYCIIGLAQRALRKQQRITDYNTMRDRVFESKSYADALTVIREYVDLIDTDGKC